MGEELDFIVIGALKAGTSTLFEHLRRHPDLFLPAAKDHPFFSHDVIHAAGWPAFASRTFREAPKEACWGKVTPYYMYGCPVRESGEAPSGMVEASEHGERIIPERIRAQFPDVKLIAILRDPVERCVSHYGMRVLRGHEDSRSFDGMIAELLTPGALESCRRLEGPRYVVWGEYGPSSSRTTSLPARTHHGLLHERPRPDPQDLMRQLFDFLAVDPGFMPSTVGAIIARDRSPLGSGGAVSGRR